MVQLRTKRINAQFGIVSYDNLDKNLIEVIDSAKPAMFLKICLNNVSKAAFSFISGHLTKFNQIDHKVLVAAF